MKQVKKGIKTLIKFFGYDLAKEIVAKNNQIAFGGASKVDLIVANNVLAQGTKYK